MQYQQLGQGSQYSYPNHNIDPKEKKEEWCMKYARAAYYDFSFSYPKGMFSNNGGDYQKHKLYAIGKQPINQYKKDLGVDLKTDETWLRVNWNVRPIITPYRNKAISSLMERDLSVIATPIDLQAKTEMDNYYNVLKAKIAVNQLLQQSQNPDLQKHPMIALQPGEPLDMEELQMRMTQGEQFNRSRDAELAIAVGFYENDYPMFLWNLYADLWDLGAAGYKEWLGDDNKAKFRNCNLENVGISYCRKKDFSDALHVWEKIKVPLVELALLKDEKGNTRFTDKDLQEFASSLAGHFGNPSYNAGVINPLDKFNCEVVDMEFFSYDDYTYSDRKDANDNPVFMEEKYGRGSDSNKRYVRKRYQATYKCKWIVGTEFAYDWGLCYDQKRVNDPKKRAKTSLSYKFIAYNFYEMKAQGMMEALEPFLDAYQLTMYKIDNFKNRSVPSGWWIDLDGLERTALNKGGKNMTPMELLDMFFETGVLVGRSMSADGTPMYANSHPVIPIENTAASELAMFYQDLMAINEAIQRITGYNDATMGEANPKTLVPGYQMAQTSTSQTLAPIYEAQKSLVTRLADDVLMRMKQGIKKGGTVYGQALNGNTIQFLKLDDELPMRDHGIQLEEKTTDDEKQLILQMMQNDISLGYLDTSDAIAIIETQNAKSAMLILAYKVKKAKQDQQQAKMAELQSTNNANLQAQQQAAIAAQQQLQQQHAMDMDKARLAGQVEIQKASINAQAELEKERLRLSISHIMNERSNQTKENVQDSQAASKIVASHIQAEASITKAETAAAAKSQPTT